PSFGVTSTLTVWPLLPFPVCERSSVSVSEAEAAVVLTVVPLTFQTYVSVTASPSGSLFVAVAVIVWFVVGVWLFSETVAVGTRSHVTVLSVDVDARLGFVA